VVADAGHLIESISFVGGAAANKAVQKIAGEIFNFKINFPKPQEYVALGAAKQAAKLMGL
jgi:xylulokinase